MVKEQSTRTPYSELMNEMLAEGIRKNILFGPSMPYLTTSGEILMHNLIKIKPPIIINEEDADYICDKFEDVLKAAISNIK